MKKYLKTISIILAMVIMLSVAHIMPVYGENNTKKLYLGIETIDKYADEYAQTIIHDLLKTLVGNETLYGVDINNYNDLYLGMPFHVFTNEGNYNYYYPLIENERIRCMLVVSKNEQGFSGTLAKAFTDELNLLPESIGFILYNDGNGIYAIDENICISLSNKISNEQDINFKEIYSTIISDYNISFHNVYICMKKNIAGKDIAQIVDTSFNSMPMNASAFYTPQFVTYNENIKLMDIQAYCQLQTDENGRFRGLCWAATAATIINYRKGTQVRAYTIANLMNIPYDDGAGETTVKNALAKYDITYKVSSGRPTWEKIKTNVNSAFPIALGAVCATINQGHMVTIVGYFYNPVEATALINYWNSATGYVESTTINTNNNANMYISYGGYDFKCNAYVSYS